MSPVRIPITQLHSKHDDIRVLADSWLGSCSDLSPQTIIKYQRTMRFFLAWLEGEHLDYEPQEIFTPKVIDKFKFYIRTTYHHRWGSDAVQANRPVKESTVDTYLRVVRTFAYWLETMDYIHANPFALRQVKMPKREKPHIEPFNKGQIEALMEACDIYSEHGFRNKAIILTLLDTGLRAAELCDLRLADVDWVNYSMQVRHGKGNKARLVYFSRGSTATAIRTYISRYRPPDLDEQIGEPGPLFISRNAGYIGPMGVRGLEIMLHKLGEVADISGVRCSPHTFRHTFALNFLRNGGSIEQLQALLGHEKLETVLIYVKLAGLDLEKSHRLASPVENWKLR